MSGLAFSGASTGGGGLFRSLRRIAVLVALAPAGAVYGQTTFIVNSTVDQVDAVPGDGFCGAAGGQCTFRAAVMEANSLAGADTIRFDPVTDGVPITLTIPPLDECPPFGCFNDAFVAVGDVDILENLTIIGNGAGATVLQGGADLASAVDRVLEVVSPVCLRCITTSISGVTIRYGRGASGGAGGLFINGGAAVTTVTDSVISDNEGSGMWLNFAGNLFLDRVTVARNIGPRGGGVMSRGSSSSIIVSNSTFHDNTADDGAGGGEGGAIHIDSSEFVDPTPTIVNSTFSGNVAPQGCAVFDADGLLRLHDVTVANNCAPGSGAAAVAGYADSEGNGTVALRNSVLVGPPGALNCGAVGAEGEVGSVLSEGYNLSSDASCPLAAGDVPNTDALLGPLASNGGPTQTHLPLPGSPAIDTGTPADCPATDQRGFARPVDGNGDGIAACDKGAVEAAAATPGPSPGGTIQGTAWDDVSADGVRQGGEAGLPAVQVCLFPTSPSLCVATQPDGTYQFSAVTAGGYHVYERLPVGRVATTPRTHAVTVAAGATVTAIDFGSFVPPPAPSVVDVGTSWSNGGNPVLPITIPVLVRITSPCPAASVTASIVFVDVFFKEIFRRTQSMTNTSGDTWETVFDPPFGGFGILFIDVGCAPVFANYISFLDPSGTILDGCTGQPLAGATVTLLKNEPFESGTYVVPDPAEHIPSDNPEVTTADGLYAWDVVPGRWRVQASRPGYDTVTTDPFDVPPPRLGLDITLMPTAGCNVAPVANDDAYATDQGTPLSVAAPGLLANDTDADGNAFAAVLVRNGANGSVTLNADGSFTYTPNAAFHGTDTFTYMANDGRDDSNAATVTVTVRPVNRPPVARDDAYRTKKNRAFFIAAPGVLANDADPEGSALTATLVRRPAHAFVLLFPSGALAYLPKPGFVGTDTFTYKASDGVNASNTATVTIEVRKRGRGAHDDDDDHDDHVDEDHAEDDHDRDDDREGPDRRDHR